MSARHISWRATGVLLFALAGALGPGSGGVGVLRFLLAVAGIVLLVQGRRAPLALRVERSRHRDLPHAIHEGRLARRAAQARTTLKG